MSSRNGMSGLSSREAAPKVFNFTLNEMGPYVDPVPNAKTQQKPSNKKQKPLQPSIPDSEMHGLMSNFFGNSLNKGKDKDSWKWFRFCAEVLDLDLTTAQKYWEKSLKIHYDAIKKYADYVPMALEHRDGKPYTVPTMTKSGMRFMLSQEVKGLWSKGKGTRNEQAAQLLLQFIAEDASNVANGGAKAGSSAPMQEACSPVQAQNPSPMQVLAVCRACCALAPLELTQSINRFCRSPRLTTKRTQMKSRRRATR